MLNMQNLYSSNTCLNNFLIDLKRKKQYLQKLNNKVTLINSIKEKNNIKSLSVRLAKNKKEDLLVKYIIDITFSRTNTLFHVMDFSGKLKFFSSAGLVSYKGKGKKARFSVVKSIYSKLLLKLKSLKNQPIALHFKNVGYEKFSIVKLLNKKLFIQVVKSFNLYPHNGCRGKKMQSKKFKKEEMAEWFKAADCKSVDFIIAGSNPAFFNYFEI